MEELKSPLHERKYIVLSAPVCEGLANHIQNIDPSRFHYFPSQWNKFPDGQDEIILGGFDPYNYVRGSHVLFLASFHNNDTTLAQFHALVVLCESFIESLTVVLPFYPVGTMERVLKEGVVATANTTARLFSSLPTCGKPTRFMVYDIHTLQNRFYFSNHTIASLHTAVPLLLRAIGAPGNRIDAIAYPDDGAAKRFSKLFPGFPTVICGKIRDGDKRIVHIQDGDAAGHRLVIVDDLVRSGGTLVECAKAMKAAGAVSVSAFVTHAAFDLNTARHFYRGGSKNVFEHFYVTNSCPAVTDQLPRDDCFVVLDLAPLIIEDL